MSAGRVVLIVEDNERNLRLARDVLEFHGYRVVAAENAEDGVALAAAHRPDVILMDLALPGMDGVEALGVLRANGDTAAIPVVALTASVMQTDRERVREAGFAGLIAKPIDVLTFHESVAGYCRSEPAR